MSTKLPHEVLDEVNKRKTKAEKIQILKKYESWALKDIIRGSMDTSINWLLPTGAAPPYVPSQEHSTPTSILREHKKFAYFAKGGKGPNLPMIKRETMFIGILEGIHPEDAKLCVDMINKKTPKGLTKAIVNEAFPGLLRD